MKDKGKIPTEVRSRFDMWDTLSVQLVVKTDPAISLYVRELQKYYSNGEVKYGCFLIDESKEFDKYAEMKQLKEIAFLKYLWDFNPVKKFFRYGSVREDVSKSFFYSSPFHLGGDLASTLNNGGAYLTPEWDGIQAKQLGEKAAAEFLGNDYDSTAVFVSQEPWSRFFYDVAWDNTWIVYNHKTRELHILMATDTD